MPAKLAAMVCATLVSMPPLARSAISVPKMTQPVMYRMPTRRASARSIPTVASMTIAKLVMKKMMLGARKNLLPGTIAYTKW